VLRREKDADAIFKDLLARANLAGQLYALCGIYYTDPDAFQHAIDGYRKRTDSVTTFSGCILSRTPVEGLIEHAGPRAVRLKGPSDTIDAWLKREGSSPQSFFVDIVGGGYPVQLRDMPLCKGR